MVTLELVNYLKLNRQQVLLHLTQTYLIYKVYRELSLGGVVLGGTEVVIREFSTDATNVPNPDNIVPNKEQSLHILVTECRGGGANLNVRFPEQVRLK